MQSVSSKRAHNANSSSSSRSKPATMRWKEVEYNGSDSVERLRRLQALCASASIESDPRPDGLLIIGGVDSFHSQASQAALKYLFLGSSGQELLGEQVISHEHERLEDVILLISRQRIAVFYSSESEAAVKILPVISKWRHVAEYIVHDGMEPDEQEERKIRAFKSMMAGIQRVGIPFGLDSEGKDLVDTMLPEKWPLIQSYGLEGGESIAKGFFTMNHQVVNVSAELMRAMAQLDGFSAKRVVLESEPFLAHHFDEFLLKLDHAESPEVRNAKSESDLGEDLLSFYEFGTMQFPARGLTTQPTRGSRVLYGARTSSLTVKSSSSAFLANSGAVQGIAATHMLVQAEDPFTGVRLARTYFLSSSKVCRKIVDEDALVHLPVEDLASASNAKDTQRLIELYALLLQGFKASAAKLVQEYMTSDEASLEQCVAAARAGGIQLMAEMSRTQSQVLESSAFPANFLGDQLRLTAEVLDSRGQPVQSTAQDWCLLYCSMTLANIPSAADSTVSLGSLRVGDTFLFRGRGAAKSAPGDVLDHVLIVTKPFAYFRSWIQNGEEADAIQVLERSLQSDFMLQSRSVRLGKALPPLDVDSEPKIDADDESEGTVAQAEFLAFSKATLVLDSEVLPILSGSWRVFTEGFVFKSPHMNPILVSFQRNVESLQILPSQHEELVLLKMDFKTDERSHLTPLSEALPFAFRSRSLYIPLLSGSRFQEDVLRVLTVWKDTAATLNIPIYRPSDFSEKFEGDTPRDGELANFNALVCVKATCDLLVQKRHFVGQDARTIGAFFPQDFIPKDPNASTTLSKFNAVNLSKLCIPITVLLGIPGSDVMTISRSICEISASSFEWIHVEIDLRDMETSKQSCMEASGCLEVSSRLKKALDRVQTTAQSMRLHPRIMLAIVGYVDPITVASAIKRTSREASIQSKISTMITCVSASNVYLPDPMTTQAPFPKVFDQMTAGFATHVVLTNSADVTSPLLQRLRFRMDQVNSFADVLVLSHDVFEGPLTPLLAVDRFESAYYKQYRDVHFCDWENATVTNSDALSSAGFAAELEAEYSPVTFRFEVVPGMDRSKFAYLVTRALTPFATMTNSMDKIYPIETSPNKASKGIRIAQSIAVEKVRQASGASTPLSTVESAFSGRSCWCVEGRVVFEDAPSSIHDYRSSSTLARLWLAPDQQDGKGKTPPSLELKITGQGLNAGRLRELLLNCYAHAEMSPNQVRSKATISLEEKREIQRQHAMEPLPDGYLFDGSTYVDFFGGRYEFHPNIARFIDEHIAAANDDRKATNLKATEERESQQAFVRQLL